MPHKRKRTPARRVRLGRERPRVDEEHGVTVVLAMGNPGKARSLAAVLTRANGYEVAVKSSARSTARRFASTKASYRFTAIQRLAS